MVDAPRRPALRKAVPGQRHVDPSGAGSVAHAEPVQRTGSRSQPRPAGRNHGPAESEIWDRDALLRQHAFGESCRANPHRLPHHSGLVLDQTVSLARDCPADVEAQDALPDVAEQVAILAWLAAPAYIAAAAAGRLVIPASVAALAASQVLAAATDASLAVPGLACL